MLMSTENEKRWIYKFKCERVCVVVGFTLRMKSQGLSVSGAGGSEDIMCAQE